MSGRNILLWFNLFVCAQVFGQKYGFKSFSQTTGLPSPGVYDIAEDNKGLIWLALGEDGAWCWDGYSLQPASFADNSEPFEITTLFTASDGTVWAGTENGDVLQLMPEGKVIHRLAGNGNPVRALGELSDSTLFAAVWNVGLICANGASNKTLEELNSHLPSKRVRCLLKDQHRRLWLGTDAGLLSYTAGNIALYDTSSGLPSEDIHCLYQAASGELWAGTEYGAAHFLGESWALSLENEMLGSRIRSISEDANGALWFALRSGILRSQKDQGGDGLTWFQESNGLSNGRVRKIFRDKSNCMWFATAFGGVCRINDLRIARFDAATGIPDNIITSLAYSNSRIYAGTYEGNLYEVGDGKVIEIYNGRGSNDNGILAITSNEDRLAFATQNQNAFLRETSGSTKKVFNGFQLRDLEFDRNGNLWAISGKELIFPDKPAGIRSPEFPSVPFTCLSVSEEDIIIGTQAGIIQYIPTTNKWQRREEAGNYAINDIYQDASGNRWIATEGNGMWVLRNNTLRPFRLATSMPTLRIRSVCGDGQSLLYAGTAAGIIKLEIIPEEPLLLQHEIIGKKTLNSIECLPGSIICSPKGNLWIGTYQGLIEYVPKNAFPDTTAPHLILEGLYLRHELYGLAETDAKIESNGTFSGLSLDFDQNQIGFQFKALEPGNDFPVEYQYRLIGADSSWSPVITGREASFFGLKPGDYTFQVRARNRDGIWSSPISSSFRIKHPFYGTWWFIMGCAGVIAAAVWVGVRFRLAFLRRENRRLEQRVAERTLELATEKERTDELLLNILPEQTAAELKKEGVARPRKYSEASVLFSDFKGFTGLTESTDSTELVRSLDECFRAFDRNTSRFGVEKIKTIGDAYMCATGVPKNDPNHAEKLVSFAFCMLDEIERINSGRRDRGLPIWEIRIGINSGPLIAGVVGEKKFAYDIWGDTVNTAARMESGGKVGRINISRSTWKLIKHRFDCTPRGKKEAKNKGDLEMYFVERPINQG
jgi:class 3 adenylate cyclase/ligand-binding sensor domain-containing protein